MNIKKIAKIRGGQDGAIWGDELFRFDTRGHGTVYDLSAINKDGTAEPKGEFLLDRAEQLVPHSNAVCFGTEFYEEGDGYPLLYTNVYNNYAKQENPYMGVCCVYRLQKDGEVYKTTLVQLIEIGFCEKYPLWKAYEDKHGARPYGNFVIDRENASYYAFVMKNQEMGTSYFKFDLPSVKEGDIHPLLGVRHFVLTEADIRERFDCSFHRYIQGAILHDGCIYSTEGFTGNEVNRPAIRIIDLAKKEEQYIDIMKEGFQEEPEMIDFYDGTCYYSDAYGNLYTIEF